MSIQAYPQFYKFVLSSASNNAYTYNDGEFTFPVNLPMFINNNGRWVFDIETLSIESQDIIDPLKVYTVASLRKSNNLLAFYDTNNGSDTWLDSSGYMRHAVVNSGTGGVTLYSPLNNGSILFGNSTPSGGNASITFIDTTNHINTFKSYDNITVAGGVISTSSLDRTVVSFSASSTTIWRVYTAPVSSTVRLGFSCTQNGITLFNIFTSYQIRNGNLFQFVASSSPTSNAFWVNGVQLTSYATGSSNVGCTLNGLGVTYSTIGAARTSLTTSIGGFAGYLKNIAILGQFADTAMVNRLNKDLFSSSFANLHIRELHQVNSYVSNRGGAGQIVLSFNKEYTKKEITTKTVAHTLSRVVDFVRTPFTFYFTDNAMNKVNVPNGVFHVVVKFWRVDD